MLKAMLYYLARNTRSRSDALALHWRCTEQRDRQVYRGIMRDRGYYNIMINIKYEKRLYFKKAAYFPFSAS